MGTGDKVLFTPLGIPERIQQEFPEVESWLQIQTGCCKYTEYNNKIYTDVNLLCTTGEFIDFFPYGIKSGTLEEAFTAPDRVAISESFARRMFGDKNPLDEIIYIWRAKKSADKWRL